MTNDDDSGRKVGDEPPTESDAGMVEPPPVSQRVLELYRQVRRTQTRDERGRVMMALAIAFSQEHDFTDFEATDDWHAYIEEFEEARLRYERSGLRLARLVLNTLDEYYDGDEPEIVATVPPPQSKLIN
jgi:hypothetical protein